MAKTKDVNVAADVQEVLAALLPHVDGDKLRAWILKQEWLPDTTAVSESLEVIKAPLDRLFPPADAVESL